MAIKFEKVEEMKQGTKLGVGKHLVRATKCTNVFVDSEKNETPLTDMNGIEKWNVTFKDKDNNFFYEDAQFSGIWANKTGFYFKAIGLLDSDEKITETKKEFECSDVIDKWLYIVIEQDAKRIGTKYENKVKFDGYEPYNGMPPIEGTSKPKAKSEPVEDPF